MSRALRVHLLLFALLALAIFAGLVAGSADLSDADLRTTLLSLRGARVVSSLIVGAALAAGGVVVQGLFRNPLASPSVLGTTAGAALGGQVALVAAQAIALPLYPEMIVPFGALLGALLALVVLLAFLRASEDLLALLLTGFILSSLFLSLSGFLTSLAQDDWSLGRAVVSFALGGVQASGWRQVAFATPLVVIALIASWGWGRPLDLMLSGEDEARSLGADVGAIRRWSAVWVSVLVAAAVSLGGNVAFVGLIIPHALRPFVGVSHRRLLPASALAGGIFVAFCDVVARVIPSTGEIPLGVVTGLVGAPVFLFILIRSRRTGR